MAAPSELPCSAKRLSLHSYICIACSDKQIDIEHFAFIEMLQAAERNKIKLRRSSLRKDSQHLFYYRTTCRRAEHFEQKIDSISIKI